jgi:23S rRNA (guanine745-N1)-methyltransferase
MHNTEIIGMMKNNKGVTVYQTKETKKNKAQANISRNQHQFKCPLCSGSMLLKNDFNLVCSKNHSFDLSRKGYLNLLASGSSAKYAKELFEARQQVCSFGFFDPLIQTLGEIISNYSAENLAERDLTVLDAGCGEGSHLRGLAEILGHDSNFSLFGVDIAKEGIKLATSGDADIIWAVADLAKLPFQQASFDVILNILSPANYHEFERILVDEGILIKVIPGKSYLGELRRLMFEGNDYSSDRVADYFSNKFELISSRTMEYHVELNEAILPQLLKMTPLTWGLVPEKKTEINLVNLPYVTVDFTILTGVKK